MGCLDFTCFPTNVLFLFQIPRHHHVFSQVSFLMCVYRSIPVMCCYWPSPLFLNIYIVYDFSMSQAILSLKNIFMWTGFSSFKTFFLMTDCNPTSESPGEGTCLWLWILLLLAKLSSKMPVLIYTAISNFLKVAYLCTPVSISYYHLNILANLIGENEISIWRICIYLITSKYEYFATCVYQLYFLFCELSVCILFIRVWIYFFSICMSFIIKLPLGRSFCCKLFPLWSVILIFFLL